MSRTYKFLDQQHAYFVSFATVHWIDLFTRKAYCEWIIEILPTRKRLVLYAWCIMPSHIHLIIGTKGNPRQDVLRDLKSYTSRVLREDIVNNACESRREWLMWMFERAGRINGYNNDWFRTFGSNSLIILFNYLLMLLGMHKRTLALGRVRKKRPG